MTKKSIITRRAALSRVASGLALPLLAGGAGSRLLASPLDAAGVEGDLAGIDAYWRTLRGVDFPQQPRPRLLRSSPEEERFEGKLDWFYGARYGVFTHFVPNMARHRTRIPWTSDHWNRWVDAVDVEKFASQLEEVGAGYAILSIGQQRDYYCSPNPVYEELWGFRPGEFGSHRDLPMDLAAALRKRNIRLLVYCSGSGPPANESPRALERSRVAGWTFRQDPEKAFLVHKIANERGLENWARALEWWSIHYGDRCAGWWVDGTADAYHFQRIIDGVRKGNPRALATCNYYAFSDYHYGHCRGPWSEQQKRIPPQDPDSMTENLLPWEEVQKPISPSDGRWFRPFRDNPSYKIQWHVAHYIGRNWAAPGVAFPVDEFVAYAQTVIARGGVVSFDHGTFSQRDGLKLGDGPFLRIPDDQMSVLRRVRRAVETLPR